MNLSLSEATVMLWGGGPLCWEMVSSVCEGAFTRSAWGAVRYAGKLFHLCARGRLRGRQTFFLSLLSIYCRLHIYRFPKNTYIH